MSKQILEGQSVIFSCVAEAEPAHFIVWKFKGLSISTNSSKYLVSLMSPDRWTLTVINAVFDDAGDYTCVASNRHGMNNATATLEVQGLLK